MLLHFNGLFQSELSQFQGERLSFGASGSDIHIGNLVALERLHVQVRQTVRCPRAGRVLAQVHATSAERHRGKPRALISLQLNLPLLANESTQALRQRVRDEALRYLDIA